MNNIKNIKLEVVSFEQAKALKDIGFPQNDENILVYYILNNKIELSHFNYLVNLIKYKNFVSEAYCAPVLELVAKWFREEKNIYIDVLHQYTNNDYSLWIGYDGEDEEFTDFTTYDEALIIGIDKAIELLKNKK